MIALPLITHLYIQVVDILLQLFGVLKEDIEDVVIVGLLGPSIPTIIIAGSCIGTVLSFLLGLCEISCQISQDMKVLKTVDRIIYANITLERCSIWFRSIVLYHCNGVGSSITVEGIFPCIIVREASCFRPLEVTAEVLIVFVLIQTDGLRRIHISWSTDSTIVPTTLCRHHFTWNVQAQVIFHKHRRKIEAASVTTEESWLYNTRLRGETTWYAVRHVGGTTSNSNVVVCRYRCTIYFILPVGVGKLLYTVLVTIS